MNPDDLAAWSMAEHVAISRVASRSWFDRLGGKLQAARLGRRLVDLVKGQRGVMLTLTYSRTGETSEQLWDRAQQEQHVPMFMRRLSRVTGDKYKGRWLRKVEFQKDGTLHYHLLLLGTSFIDHGTLAECWGHGFVFVSRASKTRVRYVAKYVAKTDGVPPWIALRRSGSVKLVATSPGFWKNPPKPPTDRAPYHRMPGFVPIGLRINRAAKRTTIRIEGRYRVLRLAFPDVVALLRPRAIISRTRGLWLEYGIWDAAGGHRREAAGLPALHLTRTPIPDSDLEKERQEWVFECALRNAYTLGEVA